MRLSSAAGYSDDNTSDFTQSSKNSRIF